MTARQRTPTISKKWDEDYHYKYLSFYLSKSQTDFSSKYNTTEQIYQFTREVISNGSNWQVAVESVTLYSQLAPLLIYDQNYMKVGLEHVASGDFYQAQVELKTFGEDQQNPTFIHNPRTICAMVNDAFAVATAALNTAHPATIGAGLQPLLYWDEKNEKFFFLVDQALYYGSGTPVVNIFANTILFNKITFAMRWQKSTVNIFTVGPAFQGTDFGYRVIVEPSSANSANVVDGSPWPNSDAGAALFYLIYQEYNASYAVGDSFGIRVLSRQTGFDPEYIPDSSNDPGSTAQAGSRSAILIDLINPLDNIQDNKSKLVYLSDEFRWHDVLKNGGLKNFDVSLELILDDNRSIPISIPSGKMVNVKFIFRKKSSFLLDISDNGN